MFEPIPNNGPMKIPLSMLKVHLQDVGPQRLSMEALVQNGGGILKNTVELLVKQNTFNPAAQYSFKVKSMPPIPTSAMPNTGPEVYQIIESVPQKTNPLMDIISTRHIPLPPIEKIVGTLLITDIYELASWNRPQTPEEGMNFI